MIESSAKSSVIANSRPVVSSDTECCYYVGQVGVVHAQVFKWAQKTKKIPPGDTSTFL
jgi:hypothetical protein